MVHLSPRELYEGNLEGGFPFWGPEGYFQKLIGSGNGRLFP